MNKKFLSVIVLLLAAVMLGSVSGVLAQGELGSEENPIQVFFVPSVEAGVITTGGEIMANALEEATGLHFEVFVPTSYAATIEAMCAAPDSSMGFIPANGYVLANRRCGVEVEAAAVRFGWPVYWGQILVRRDSDIFTLGDLEGKTWAYPDPGSTSGFLFPSVLLEENGVHPGEEIEAGGHGQAVLAVLRGDADFATTFFSPPLVPGAGWQPGDLPEPYDLTVDESFITEDGSALFVGDVRVLDARASVRDTAPDVVDQLRILRITDPIPNDTLSFGPDFPEELRNEIVDALIAFSETDAWNESIGNQDFYGWTSLAPVDDSNFDVVRQLIDTLGLTEDDIFG
ncbi:MAG: phosphate/phosphite/phosphonate ABC transporter substrate-binding protein [Chloroflexi bacterium]|nr:MAG: phosphate/phosphite/phosphonate ABC transporter substrate-binding protein [Chloroflexota bacterium]